jgi:hypothetical protein
LSNRYHREETAKRGKSSKKDKDLRYSKIYQLVLGPKIAKMGFYELF